MFGITQSDVFRTAHQYIDSNDENSLGVGLKHGINEICRCCKAGGMVNGKRIGLVEEINGDDLKPWVDFYVSGLRSFKAYKCHSCQYIWSWYRSAP